MAVVTLWVESLETHSERRFDTVLTVNALKVKLEPITGIPQSAQSLALYQGQHCLASLEGHPHATLDSFPIADYCTLKVTSNTRTYTAPQFTDVSQVEKYEMSDQQYETLPDSVLAFKKRNKVGRFSDESKAAAAMAEGKFEQEAAAISVGARCRVVISDQGVPKLGTVRYVGKTKFQPGYWVGVEYDEPLGKHDGSVQGEQYFSCRNKYGAFVRPDKVEVGDFTADIDWDNLDEM